MYPKAGRINRINRIFLCSKEIIMSKIEILKIHHVNPACLLDESCLKLIAAIFFNKSMPFKHIEVFVYFVSLW